MIKEFKKNCKAFTLVELLVTIAIIGFLAASMTVAAYSMWQRQNDNYNQEIISNLEEAACVYVGLYLDTTSATTVKITDLVSKGLVDSDIVATLNSIKEIDGVSFTYKDYVKVTWSDDGEKTCNYEYN